MILPSKVIFRVEYAPRISICTWNWIGACIPHWIFQHRTRRCSKMAQSMNHALIVLYEEKEAQEALETPRSGVEWHPCFSLQVEAVVAAVKRDMDFPGRLKQTYLLICNPTMGVSRLSRLYVRPHRMRGANSSAMPHIYVGRFAPPCDKLVQHREMRWAILRGVHNRPTHSVLLYWPQVCCFRQPCNELSIRGERA